MKHNLIARMTCALLALLMLLSVAACGAAETTDTTAADGVDTATTTTGATTPAETAPPTHDAEGYWLDDLPDDLYYNGDTVTMLTWKDVEHEEFFVEAQTGDLVSDAIFERNQAVEERLGIKFGWIEINGDAGENANFNAYISQQLLAGTHEFDIIGTYSLTAAAAAVNGYLFDLLDPACEHLNFDQPWWPNTLLDQATINNQLRFCSGDISMNTLYMMYVCYVNTDILASQNLQNPAELVLEGKWTYDKFIEMCAGIYEDKNGNGIKDGGDRFGYLTTGVHVDPWFYGTGAVMAKQDANGQLQISDSFAGEKIINGIDKINALLWDTNDGFYSDSVGHQPQFRDENLLFMIDRARVSFRVLPNNPNLHYTIVPCPKYDEQQEEYCTAMGNPFTMYCIPIDCQDPSQASAVIECFASESYRTTTPAVFELTLKLKYAQDDITGQMYDIIRSTVTFDIGRIFSAVLIGQDLFRNSIKSNRNSWASDVKANLKPLEKKLEKLQEAFAD